MVTGSRTADMALSGARARLAVGSRARSIVTAMAIEASTIGARRPGRVRWTSCSVARRRRSGASSPGRTRGVDIRRPNARPSTSDDERVGRSRNRSPARVLLDDQADRVIAARVAAVDGLEIDARPRGRRDHVMSERPQAAGYGERHAFRVERRESRRRDDRVSLAAGQRRAEGGPPAPAGPARGAIGPHLVRGHRLGGEPAAAVPGLSTRWRRRRESAASGATRLIVIQGVRALSPRAATEEMTVVVDVVRWQERRRPRRPGAQDPRERDRGPASP